jgi:hypothetical protein
MNADPSNHDATAELRSLKSRYRELAEAAIDYDLAIQACANDPAKMATYCTAQGDTLDSLYVRWLGLAMKAAGDPVAEDGSAPSDKAPQVAVQPTSKEDLQVDEQSRGEPVAWTYRSPAQVEFNRKPTLTDDAELVRLMLERGDHEVTPLVPAAQPKPEQVNSPEIPDGSKPEQAVGDGVSQVRKELIAFEAWAVKEGFDVKRHNKGHGKHINSEVDAMWTGWLVRSDIGAPRPAVATAGDGFSLAFKYGFRAFGRSVPFESNPYGKDDIREVGEWAAGWMAAKTGEVSDYDL